MKLNKITGLIGLIILVLGSSCGTSGRARNDAPFSGGGDPTIQPTTEPIAVPSQQTLSVFAAASLSGAFGEIGREFEAANPGSRVNFNFGGSQILRTQLEQGAQADIYAPADEKSISALITDGLVEPNSVHNFATNSLVVVLPADNPGNIQNLGDLAKPKLKLVLADVSVPAGNYARQVLINMSRDPQYGVDFNTRVLANVVSNETDVKQVVAKVELGEADAGIVYVTDAVAAPKLIKLDIPAKFNVNARYPIALISNSSHPELARRFIAYVASTTGQDILAKWGFMPPEAVP